ncbi:hypothetical protein pb186bvf_003324 [Paramecium bursaria]
MIKSPTFLIQSMLLIDALLSFLQGFITKESYYSYTYGVLLILQLVLIIIDKKMNQHIVSVCIHTIQGSLQVSVAFQFRDQWICFSFLQLAALIYLDQTYSRPMCVVFFCVLTVNFSISNSLYIGIAVLRSFFTFGLASQIFKYKDYGQQFLPKLMESASLGSKFVILNEDLSVVYNQQLMAKLLEINVKIPSEVVQISRIISPRETETKKNVLLPVNTRVTEEIATGKLITLKQLLSQKQKKSQQWETEAKETLQITYFENYIFISQKKNKQAEIKIYEQRILKQVYRVSHDMRTPLNAIINMQTCLKDIIDPFLTDRYLKPSLNSCKLLLNLLNDILDAAQSENNQIRLVFRKFFLKKLIEKTIEIFVLISQKKNIKITYQCDYKIPKYVNSDKNRVRQILINLVSNAVKYTPQNGSIFIECNQGLKNSIQISVQDSGLGIKEENIKLLFNDFNKIIDKENQLANPHGVGLGLQISNDLAKMLSPDQKQGIEVQSQYRAGSKFTFTILNNQNAGEDISDSMVSDRSKVMMQDIKGRFIEDLNVSEHKSPTLSQPLNVGSSSRYISMRKNANLALQLSRPSLFQQQVSQRLKNTVDMDKSLSKKISTTGQQIQNLIQSWNEKLDDYNPVLIVDDNEFNIVALQYLLEQFEILSDSEMSGVNCLTKVIERGKQNRQYQLIFMDIEMPIMDGIQTCKKIVEIDKNLKVVACSAYRVNDNILDDYRSQGMYAAIEKPVSRQAIRELLQSIIDKDKEDK